MADDRLQPESGQELESGDSAGAAVSEEFR